MPVANNLATLFDFETAYEDALRVYFTGANISPAFSQVLTPRSNITKADFLRTPRLQIRAGITGLPSAGSGLVETQVQGTHYLSYQSLGLTLDVVTSRSNGAQPHGLLRGVVRQGMLEATQALTVPLYQTIFVTPQSSTQIIDPANDEIQTQLGYVIDFHIPPSSFPNL